MFLKIWWLVWQIHVSLKVWNSSKSKLQLEMVILVISHKMLMLKRTIQNIGHCVHLSVYNLVRENRLYVLLTPNSEKIIQYSGILLFKISLSRPHWRKTLFAPKAFKQTEGPLQKQQEMDFTTGYLVMSAVKKSSFKRRKLWTLTHATFLESTPPPNVSTSCEPT